jgi:hypothetical protein
MKIFVSCSRPGTNAWAQLPVLTLSPIAGTQDGTLELRDAPISLPDSETLLLSAAYQPKTRAIALMLLREGRALLNMSAFQRAEEVTDPTVIVMTPTGTQISISFGPAK